MSTTSSHRLGAEASASARIDRSREITFTVDGKTFTGFAGDTVASAMLGAGLKACGPSLYLQRPRGIMSAGVETSTAAWDHSLVMMMMMKRSVVNSIV